MANVVITISRQYGSGGRTVGKMLADRLGIEFWDKDIMRIASDQSGVNQALFGNVDEYVSKKPFFLQKNEIYTGEVASPSSKDFTSSANLFALQSEALKKLAEEGSCVIIGRCSNFVLKDMPNVVSVLVHAPWEFRVEKASEKLAGTRKDVEKFLQKDDKRKEEYYKRFTGREWMDPTNYDLCLNAEKLGYESCVEMVIKQLELEHLI